MSKRKKWLGKCSTIKEEKGKRRLPFDSNTQINFAFFQVVEKEAAQSSDDLYSNSPPISSQSDTVQEKIFSGDDDDIESLFTSDIQSSHLIKVYQLC